MQIINLKHLFPRIGYSHACQRERKPKKNYQAYPIKYLKKKRGNDEIESS